MKALLSKFRLVCSEMPTSLKITRVSPRRSLGPTIGDTHVQILKQSIQRHPSQSRSIITYIHTYTRMPYPSNTSPSLLAKCGTTLTCILRSVPLWAVVLIVLLLGAVRRRVSVLLFSEPQPPPPSKPRSRHVVGKAP